MSINALRPSGKLPTTRVRRRISRFSRSIMLFVRMRRRCSRGVVVEQVGRGLADALPEAFGGLPQFPRLHVLGDGFRLLQRLVPRFHGEYGLQRVGGPVPVFGVDLGEDVAFEVDHAPL